MDIWEELKKNLASAVDVTSREASRLTAEAKLKINIAVTEKHIDEKAAELGKLRYNELRKGEDNTAAIEAAAAGLDELYAKLDELKNPPKTEDATEAPQRSARICISCGTVISDDAVYCSKCGTKQE